MDRIISLKFKQESYSYKILIGNGFLNSIVKNIKNSFKFSKAVVLMDRNVKRFYYEPLAKIFRDEKNCY